MSVAPTKDENRALVQRLLERDPKAMMELYDRYSRLLYSIILRAVHDSAAAEDLTQETFLRVWNRIGTFDVEKGRFEGWLVTIARNRAFDYLRSRRNVPEHASISLTDLEHSSFFASSGSSIDRLTLAQAAKDALKKLNQDQREVIELTHFEGLSQTEIAGKLKKPLGTVKGLVRSALKNLRAALLAAGAQSVEVRHDM